MAWTLIAFLAAGCTVETDSNSATSGGTEADDSDGGSGDGGGGDPDDPRFDDDGNPIDEGDEPDPSAGDPTGPIAHDIDPPSEGDVVAQLELELPGHDQFVLRGTVPVPKGVFPQSNGSVPLAILDYDGTPLPSQVEAVAWYPDASDGADVVEVLALVGKDPALAKGDRTQYDVVFSPHDGPATAPSASLSALKNVTHAVPPSVESLLDQPGDVFVRAKDVFGHTYEVRPLQTPHKRLRRGGRAATQISTYGDMMPTSAVSGSQGTLPHLFGVHAYVSTWSGQPTLGFDLRFSNAHIGVENGTQDDALGRMYFADLEVVVPLGWQVDQAYEDPGLGDPYTEGSSKVFPLVKPLAGGKMHLMPWQQQFHRRLVIRPNGAAAEGRELLDHEGLAFCVKGDSPTTGDALYSWWNPGTSRFFQQRALLPSLDHVGLPGIRNSLENEFDDLAGHMKNGTDKGGYPIVTGHMGYAHPWGVEYGGMTGGSEVQFWEGVDTAAAAHTPGYQYLELLHRMQTDRQQFAAFRSDGVPTSVEDWLKNSPIKHVPFDYFITAGGNSDPFKEKNAPDFQVKHVENTGKKPSYQNQMLSFDPHDFQHYSRYTRAPMALAWLGNDFMSKDDLLLCAEMFNLSFHQYANNANGGLQGSGMKQKINGVKNKPGVGTSLGRGEGHGTACMNAVYAFEPSWRAAKMPWYKELAELAFDGTSECNGFLQSIAISKGLDGKYKVRQCIEQCIFDNAMRGVASGVFADVEPAYVAMTNDRLEQSYYALISTLSWEVDSPRPWAWTAVAPLSGAAYCDDSELPPDWHEPYYQDHLIWGPLGYAYEQTGDTTFLEFAGKATQDNGSAFNNLMNDELKNLDNRAGVLAVIQFVNGVL